MVERFGVTGWRECGRFAEAHVHKNIVEGVCAACDDHVRFAGFEFEGSEMECAQGAGARGVDYAVRSASVEVFGDASGDDVSEKARE